jgi:peptidoglycan hydrolase CwlO-like protein
MTTETSIRQRVPSREIQSAEAQIATVDEQLDEMTVGINDAELQIEAMEDEIRKRKNYIRSTQRKIDKLTQRRAVFIDAVSALRKLDR